jgi:hypothetical protein
VNITVLRTRNVPGRAFTHQQLNLARKLQIATTGGCRGFPLHVFLAQAERLTASPLAHSVAASLLELNKESRA